MMSVSMFANEPSKVMLHAGDYLFRDGDNPDFLYILLYGQAGVWVGKREVEVFGPGEMIGEMALIESAPRTASVQAKMECEFARIDAKRFMFLITETPGFALSVMRTMAARLRSANRLIESLD